MRIITNERLARRNRRIATYLFIFAFASLIVSFLLTGNFIQPANEQLAALLPLVSFFILPLALITVLISSRMTNLWLRRPRPEEELPAHLKGFSERSAFFSYYHFPARHVLVCPQGVFAIITRYQEGYYEIKGERWSTRRGMLGRLLAFFRMEAIGNPSEEAERAAAHLQGIIDRVAADIPVQPLVVFISERAQLEIDAPTVPVLRAQAKLSPSLAGYLRDARRRMMAEGRDMLLDGGEMARAIQALQAVVPESGA